MYRKRKAARQMFDSLEKKAPSVNSEKQKVEVEPGAQAAVSTIWTPVSTVDSFCNTSHAAGERCCAARDA